MRVRQSSLKLNQALNLTDFQECESSRNVVGGRIVSSQVYVNGVYYYFHCFLCGILVLVLHTD